MIRSASRPLAVASAIAIATMGVAAIPTPASAHWSCGREAPGDIDTSGNHTAKPGSVARVGSSVRCAISSSDIYARKLDYHCWAMDIDLHATWTYVVSVGGGRGWVNDSQLDDRGSTHRCPGDTTSLAAATLNADGKPVFATN